MLVGCTKCGKEAAEREPGMPCAIERYVCGACGADFFVHCNYLANIPSTEKIYWYSCSYTPSSGIAAAKEYIKLKRVVRGFTPNRAGNLEAQYASRAAKWNIGLLSPDQSKQLVQEAANAGLVIERLLEPDI